MQWRKLRNKRDSWRSVRSEPARMREQQLHYRTEIRMSMAVQKPTMGEAQAEAWAMQRARTEMAPSYEA